MGTTKDLDYNFRLALQLNTLNPASSLQVSVTSDVEWHESSGVTNERGSAPREPETENEKKSGRHETEAGVWQDFPKQWHHCVGKLLCVPSYLSLTSEVSGNVWVHRASFMWKHRVEALAPLSLTTPCTHNVCTRKVHIHTPRISQCWKTWRKPDQDWGSAGRKWNTPLDLNRKQPGKEDSDRMHTHTFSEFELYELEHCIT